MSIWNNIKIKLLLMKQIINESSIYSKILFVVTNWFVLNLKKLLFT